MSEITKDEQTGKDVEKKKKKSDLDRIADNVEKLTGMKPQRKKMI